MSFLSISKVPRAYLNPSVVRVAVKLMFLALFSISVDTCYSNSLCLDLCSSLNPEGTSFVYCLQRVGNLFNIVSIHQIPILWI